MIRRATAPALLCVLAALAMLSGCGIRATSVPVDAGAAPSRVGCVLPNDHKGPDGGDTASVIRVYLVCGSRVSPVEREVRMPGGRSSAERLPVARKLLDELKQQPRAVEDTAGFETAVPRELTINSGTDDDPDEALRLSEPLDELPPYALAQIVCTYADTSAADAEGGVVLGGPPETDSGKKPQVRRYECGPALRTHPQSAESAGTHL
ncbi:hypothetical protein ACQEU8_13720 [Streptomyces sp. CA-250714]|uniref:hypothetical protein n=1 Tax=Streptomyces sp. CA-250714 TaxID=3240060 RepID=UPI003D8B5BB0